MKLLLLILIATTACQQKEITDSVDNSAYDALDKSFLTIADFERLSEVKTGAYGSAALFALRSVLSPRMAVNQESADSDSSEDTVLEWEESCKDAPPSLSDLSLRLISRSRWIAADHRQVDSCTAKVGESTQFTYQSVDYQVLLSQLCEAGDYSSFQGQTFKDITRPFFTCDFSTSSVQSRSKSSFELSVNRGDEPTSVLKVSQHSLMMDPDGNDCIYRLEEGGQRVEDCVFADHYEIESQANSGSSRMAEKIIWKYTDVLTNPEMKVIEGQVELLDYQGWTGQFVVWKDDPNVSYRLTRGTETMRGSVDCSTSLKSWVHNNLLHRILQQAVP